jgi:Nucleotide-diphospho-sugar transferase
MFQIVQNGTSSAEEWGSTGLNALVSMRPAHIGRKLQEVINIVYTDVDTIWRSSPLPYLAAAGSEADSVASVHAVENGESSPFYATGLLAVASNNRTIELFQQWHELHRATSTMNTPTFNRVLFSSSTVKHQPLPWKEFPNGKMYFEQFTSSQRARVIVVHNDYIAGGSSRSGRGLKKSLECDIGRLPYNVTREKIRARSQHRGCEKDGSLDTGCAAIQRAHAWNAAFSWHLRVHKRDI